jgi:hypothetical protein
VNRANTREIGAVWTAEVLAFVDVYLGVSRGSEEKVDDGGVFGDDGLSRLP